MTKPHIDEDLEPVLDLIPLVTAADTIRSYCLQFDKCKGCKFNGAYGKGCYFNNVTPDKWNIGQTIYEQTEEIGKDHFNRPGRRFNKMNGGEV